MIKYHDNIHGQQYGEDHMLTDNWNPNADYADNEYISVHFRIEFAPYTRQMYDHKLNIDKEMAEFNKEKWSVFKSLGWEMKCNEHNGCCMEVTKGKQELYLHPQDFSGVVLKKEVKTVAEALENNKTFSLRWVDVYKDILDISDSSYKAYLEAQKEEARKFLMHWCRTSRVNKYMSLDTAVWQTALTIMKPRVGNYEYQPSAIDLIFISSVVSEMAYEGYLIRCGDDYIRAANKTELKKAKLKEIA